MAAKGKEAARNQQTREAPAQDDAIFNFSPQSRQVLGTIGYKFTEARNQNLQPQPQPEKQPIQTNKETEEGFWRNRWRTRKPEIFALLAASAGVAIVASSPDANQRTVTAALSCDPEEYPALIYPNSETRQPIAACLQESISHPDQPILPTEGDSGRITMDYDRQFRGNKPPTWILKDRSFRGELPLLAATKAQENSQYPSGVTPLEESFGVQMGNETWTVQPWRFCFDEDNCGVGRDVVSEVNTFGIWPPIEFSNSNE